MKTNPQRRPHLVRLPLLSESNCFAWYFIHFISISCACTVNSSLFLTGYWITFSSHTPLMPLQPSLHDDGLLKHTAKGGMICELRVNSHALVWAPLSLFSHSLTHPTGTHPPHHHYHHHHDTQTHTYKDTHRNTHNHIARDSDCAL